MPEGDPVTNFFIKFKQNVDTHIASVFQGALGLPSVVSKHTHSSGRWPEPLPPSSESKTNTSNPDSHGSTPSPPQTSCTQPHQTIWSLLPMRTLLDVEAVSESLYQLMWMSFLIDSEYSPLRLRHLPQPVPRDLPEGADASLFGFEDAFEDLLSVTSGQGLMDIHEWCAMKKEWQHAYPQGLPPLMWLHQLTRQGLWDGWEARPDFVESIVSERWRRWLDDQNDPFRNGSQEDEPSRVRAEQNSGQTSNREVGPDTSASDGRSPAVEEDMYRLFEQGRAITQSLQSGLDILRRLGEPSSSDSEDRPHDLLVERQQTGTSESRGLPKGWRENVTVDERTDDEGYTTVSRTRVVYDDNDRPVSTTTMTKTARSVSFDSSGNGTKGGSVDDKGSWFWK